MSKASPVESFDADRQHEGALIGDLAHTQGELVHGWDLNFNFDHRRAIETIERFRKYIYDNQIPFAAPHFPGMRWGVLEKSDVKGGIAHREID